MRHGAVLREGDPRRSLDPAVGGGHFVSGWASQEMASSLGNVFEGEVRRQCVGGRLDAQRGRENELADGGAKSREEGVEWLEEYLQYQHTIPTGWRV